MRSQVVNGNARSAGGRHVGEIERHQAEVAGLEHQVHRLERRQARTTRHRCRAPTADAEDRARARTPTPDRTDRTDRPAPPLRHAPTPAAIAWHSSVVRPAERGPTISDSCPRGSPPPSAASIAGTPVAARSSRACRHGAEVVSVTSSLRARSSDSRWARAVMARHRVSLYFRLRREYRRPPPGIKRQSSHPCKCWKDGC